MAEDQKDTIALMAEIIAGLAVPASMAATLLGTAYQPWVDIRRHLELFGWNTKEEIEQALREQLACEVPSG